MQSWALHASQELRGCEQVTTSVGVTPSKELCKCVCVCVCVSARFFAVRSQPGNHNLFSRACTNDGMPVAFARILKVQLSRFGTLHGKLTEDGYVMHSRFQGELEPRSSAPGKEPSAPSDSRGLALGACPRLLKPV